MDYKEFVRIIEKIAPPDLAEDWDNSGVQINCGKEQINSVLVCLEITEEVVKEAKAKRIDLIITHHPLIFYPIKSIDAYGEEKTRPISKYIIELIKAEIGVYSAHLSFDNASRGNNHYMGEKIGLRNLKLPIYNPKHIPGIIGEWEKPVTFEEACDYVERGLELPKGYIKTVDISGPNKEDKDIKRVALCTGGGGDFLEIALKEKCDLFISGDIRFHEAQLAKASHIALIDAGHYGTEKIFAENFAHQLRKNTGNKMEILESNSNCNPYML